MNMPIFHAKKIKPLFIMGFALLIFLGFDRVIFLTIKRLATYFYTTKPPSQTGLTGYRQSEKIERGYYDTLILGTSRTIVGIHPIYLHRYLSWKAYNAADKGRYPRFNYHFYEKFIKKNGPVRHLIYGIDYFMFDQESNRRQLRLLLDRPRLENPPLTVTHKINPNSPLFSRLSLLYRVKPEIDEFLGDLIDFMNQKATSPMDQVDAREIISDYCGEVASVPIAYRNQPLNWQKAEFQPYPGKEGIWLKKLLDRLQQDKVHTFLVILPDYINVYRTNFQREKFIAEIRRVIADYPNITVFNYNLPSKFNLANPRYFVDGKYGDRISHLSRMGARIFNRRLCRDITELTRVRNHETVR